MQYTDFTFSTRKSREEAEVHLGMLGPVLMAEVGDTVEVRVKNMASRPYSFLPHGVVFNKDNEGFVYRNPECEFRWKTRLGRLIASPKSEIFT